MSILKKSVVAVTLAATALATSSPAMARDHYRNNDDTAAIAIGAGIIGLAIGAIAASSGKNSRYDRYDNRYHVRDGWYYNDGYYYNRSGERYKRNAWERRYSNNRYYDNGRYNGPTYSQRYDERRSSYGNYYNRRGY